LPYQSRKNYCTPSAKAGGKAWGAIPPKKTIKLFSFFGKPKDPAARKISPKTQRTFCEILKI
jgi:hypothetical protein